MNGRKLNTDEMNFISELITDNRVNLQRYVTHIYPAMSIADIEDCLQELYLLSYDKYDDLFAHSNKIGWLFTSLKNIASNLYRKNKNTNSVPIEIAEYELSYEYFNSDTTFDLILQSISEDEIIRYLINHLSTQEQAIYKMKYVDEKDNAHIAENLNIKENAVRARCSDIRKKVRGIIFGEELYKYL